MKEKIRWSGSLTAQKEHEEALKQHPPKLKSKKKPKEKHKPKYKNNYKNYLKSNWWKKRSKQAKKDVNYKCEECNQTKHLEAHHKHYKTLGKEAKEDLIVLCKDCHRHKHSDTKAMNAHLDSIARGNY